MKRKNIVARACEAVPGFAEFQHRIVSRLTISGRAQSTIDNYCRHLAMLAVYWQEVPIEISAEKVESYLYQLKTRKISPSETYFKFTVYSLRFAYRAHGLEERYVAMPVIKHVKRIPSVLSKQEVRRLLAVPVKLKHKVLIALLYGCGLRCFEARQILISDVDFDRKMLFVRHGKGNRARYVPMGRLLMDAVKEYLLAEKPQTWLFNGRSDGMRGTEHTMRYSSRGMQAAVRDASLKAGISKHVSPHTLRHTFATHLLEDGLDIVTIKELLGHSKIETTMVYLHVVSLERPMAFSPLDTLYAPRQGLRHRCPFLSMDSDTNAATASNEFFGMQ